MLLFTAAGGQPGAVDFSRREWDEPVQKSITFLLYTKTFAPAIHFLFYSDEKRIS